MKITLKHIAIVAIAFIALIAFNVYQWQNPKVVETPTGTTEIDSTAWVQRNAYLNRGSIIDSLENQNEALAKKVRKYGDQIAGYTTITGKLKLQKDSLERELTWRDLPKNSLISETADSLQSSDQSFLEKARANYQDLQGLMDSTYTTRKTFGNGLFLVTGLVEFRGSQFRQQLNLQQVRDIRLDVTTTIDQDRSRILTYVTSKDFEELEYRSFTELQPKTKLPKFWIGVATGVAAMAGAAIVLN